MNTKSARERLIQTIVDGYPVGASTLENVSLPEILPLGELGRFGNAEVFIAARGEIRYFFSPIERITSRKKARDFLRDVPRLIETVPPHVEKYADEFFCAELFAPREKTTELFLSACDDSFPARGAQLTLF